MSQALIRQGSKTMSSRHNFRFVIKNSRGLRALLTVSENPKSFDLVLGLRSIGNLRQAGEPVESDQDTSNTDPEIIQQYYSIHNSPKSLIHNFIKHTLKLKQHNDINTYQYTTSIKSKERIAHIYTRRFSDLSSSPYDIKNSSGRNVTLGSFEDRYFTLIASIFIGDRDQDIVVRSEKCQIISRKTEKFSIIILFSFIFFPPGPSGLLLHSMSFKDDDLRQKIDSGGLINGTQDGVSPDECVEFHLSMVQICVHELATEWSKGSPQSSLVDTLLVDPIISRFGSKNTPSWVEGASRIARHANLD